MMFIRSCVLLCCFRLLLLWLLRLFVDCMIINSVVD